MEERYEELHEQLVQEPGLSVGEAAWRNSREKGNIWALVARKVAF